MGYTHYYRIDNQGDQQVWSAAVLQAAKLLRDAPVPLANAYGEVGTDPEFNDKGVYFNGVEPNECETLVIPTVLSTLTAQPWEEDKQRVFHFCKTREEPYDLVVTAVLATLAHYAPAIIDVSSDGDAPDWESGVQYARTKLGVPELANPLAEAVEVA
jgi:hypothetical protein